jgi:hypothetical protein
MPDITTNARPRSRRTARSVKADIWRRTLADGSRIAEVPLRDGGFVTVDHDDLARILSLGISPAWSLNSNGGRQRYVRAQAPRALGVPSLVQVARVIMEPPSGRVLKYRDGNRLNLRRANFYLEEPGRTTAKARERHFGNLPIAAE